MIDKELLDILCCPETKEDIFLASDNLVLKLNEEIKAGTLVNRGGEKVTEQINDGLLRADKKYLYPVQEDIPIMLIESGIPMEKYIKPEDDIKKFTKEIQ